jgi:hypothetical protein
MDKYTKNRGEDLFGYLNSQGSLEFGAVFKGSEVRKFLEIEYPIVGTRDDFSRVALFELNAIEYCRSTLLEEGKYLSGFKGDYRVLLPSENASQCDRFLKSAMRKLKRSARLSTNTPVGDHPPLNDKTVRAIMQENDIKNRHFNLGVTA